MISADKRHQDVISIVNVEKGRLHQENKGLIRRLLDFQHIFSGILGCLVHVYNALETIRGCLARVVGFSVAESLLMTRMRGKVPCIQPLRKQLDT